MSFISSIMGRFRRSSTTASRSTSTSTSTTPSPSPSPSPSISSSKPVRKNAPILFHGEEEQEQEEPIQSTTMATPSTVPAQVGTAGVWIFLVLDESGSMGSSQQATITAFNDYIKQQRDAKMEGDVIVSLMKFEECNNKMVYDRVNLKEVPALTKKTYVPAGSTNLHDAVGDAMSRIDNKLNESDSLLERSAVFFVVLTDGEENASRHYTGARIKEMITARREVGWQFIFLGANIEAADVAESLGISRATAFQCNTEQSSGYSEAMKEITFNYRSKCAKVQKTAAEQIRTKSSVAHVEAMKMLNTELNNTDFDMSTRAKFEAPAPKMKWKSQK